MSARISPRLLLILLLISLFPQLVFVGFKAPSITFGFSIACGVACFVNLPDILKYKMGTQHKIILVLSLMIITLSSLYQLYRYDEIKPLYSIPVIIIMLTGAIATSSFLSRIPISAIKGSILAVCLILIGIGWLKLFYVPPFLNYNMYIKPVFPYSEESHFALSLGMFACAYAIIGQKRWSIFIAANMMGLAFSYPSLTLVIFLVLNFAVMLLHTNRRFVLFALFTLFPFVIYFLINYIFSFDYFSERLDFVGMNNLTTLVFFQGWELAYLNVLETYGLGLGFQGLGSERTVIGDMSNQITLIASGGRFMNLSDGGLLAAKVISEFGALGVIIIAWYLAFLVRGYLRFTSTHSLLSADPATFLYALRFAFLFAFLVEMFFRGLGYFSPGSFFALVAVFGLVGDEANGARSSLNRIVRLGRGALAAPSSGRQHPQG
jgi:hypothetical protein